MLALAALEDGSGVEDVFRLLERRSNQDLGDIYRRWAAAECPDCFDEQEWMSWRAQASDHLSIAKGLHETLELEDSPQFPCGDCPRWYQQEMIAEGRCGNPHYPTLEEPDD